MIALKSPRLMALLLLLASGAARAQDVVAKVEALMKSQVVQENFAGSVLIAQEGKIVFEQGYGLANREWSIPNRPDTRFRIASLTKQFTAAGILLLQQQHRLSVKDKISAYVADLPVSWRDITIHQLLTHTSGLPSYTETPQIESLNHLGATPRQLIDLVKDSPLQFPLGSKFTYCNTGYVLLGMIVEKVSGLSYGDFLQKNIFAPLHLDDTGYDWPDRILPKRASGYELQNDTWIASPQIDISIPFAAGGLYSTVGDLFRWSEALFSDRLLTAESRDEMFRIYPEALGPGGQHYGYGMVLTERFGQTEWYHGGGVRGFATAIRIYPKARVCVVVLSNVDSVKSWDVAIQLAGLVVNEQPAAARLAHP
jgi:D-alanyl-D-alanine carboxypeptidase